jgi:sulfide:quinone oxidoreductase
MNDRVTASPPEVLIAGGGIAGLEALMALHDLAGDRVRITLAAPDPDFIYKPLIVEEPVSSQPAEQHALEPLAAEFDARFVQQGIATVHPEEHEVDLRDGSRLRYDRLVVCVGARPRPAFSDAVTLRVDGSPLSIDALLRGAADSASRRIAFVVPPGRTWPLPVYELALQAQRRVGELGLENLECCIVTPEESPLSIFGRIASDAVGALLDVRGITIHAGVRAKQLVEGELVLAPGDERLAVARIVSLPVLEGPRLAGLPADAEGFIPIDGHARVRGVDDVYAAGDGTSFPIKHGGIGTQQADAAAEAVAASVGADVDPQPFRPVVRGKLITGDESLHLQHDAGGGAGEGTASPDYLWWPPHKVSGRYLTAWLGHGLPHLDQEPPPHSLDVEVSLPKEWHEAPMALDPHRTTRVD